ncbi:hypothetical protein DFH07DRAFT_953282 [Mycena maculata]|uniref:BTB domain-containing protein n=1 Tax=Mycena maculata TaxID=230809 RepID=A0AAD7JUD3_9AGAR|nr:hypothetical protein DFH07DRAFT_953282 [Mycena maculata]
MSPALTAIFNIPPAAPVVGQPAEGTEANPVILSGMTSEAFDDFLSFFFKAHLIRVEDLTPTRKEQLCMNLLTVGCLYDVEQAKDYAKSVLVGMGLSHVCLLHIARQFAIHEWIQPAVKFLVPRVDGLTSDDVLNLGPITLSILYQAKAAIDRERLDVAYGPPKLTPEDQLNYGDCADHKTCTRVLNEVWWTAVARKILHPKKPIALDKIGDEINCVRFPGMTPKCHEDMVTKWTTNEFEEKYILEAAVTAVTKVHSYYLVNPVLNHIIVVAFSSSVIVIIARGFKMCKSSTKGMCALARAHTCPKPAH